MAEYIDREALLKFLDDTHEDRDWIVNQYNADWIYSLVESQPAADVVEVVRCRDCKYRNFYNGCPLKESGYFKNGKLLPLDNDFCSYGERRTECTTKDITK